MTNLHPVGNRFSCAFIMLAALTAAGLTGCDCECIEGLLSCGSDETCDDASTAVAGTEAIEVIPVEEPMAPVYEDVDFEIDGDAAVNLVTAMR
ncbi:MAG: hypothetical protein MK082_05160 [Phycisphaerales bacterium]|nr:hypothetical protein [Phycisphaerales bacterium]